MRRVFVLAIFEGTPLTRAPNYDQLTNNQLVNLLPKQRKNPDEFFSVS